jgi:uncharacterized protein
MRSAPIVVFLLLAAGAAEAQTPLPILDVHLHAKGAADHGPPPLALCTPMETMPVWDNRQPFLATFINVQKEPQCADPVWSPATDEEVMQQTIEVAERLNLFGVLSGTPDRVQRWMAAAPGRFLPAIEFNAGARSAVTVDSLRKLHADDRLAVIGEVTNAYLGIAPDDPRMAPFWELAVELDIPVGIHVGPGPPGAVYLGFGNYRARMHSALTMEEVLVRHPTLRVYLMHAGYPLLDDLLALLYAHPQVYVDIGVIVFTQPRRAFYRYLQGIVDAGFGNRVMFGSDQMVWPGVIERSVAVIEDAPFLSAGQKRDILYNNAARFLRLSEEEIARHHGGGLPD